MNARKKGKVRRKMPMSREVLSSTVFPQLSRVKTGVPGPVRVFAAGLDGTMCGALMTFASIR